MGLPMRRVLKPLWILLAIFFLVEAWLWDHLRAAIAWLVNLVPLDKLKSRLAALVEKLPPWAVLIVFVVPFIVLLPLKFLEVYFIVRHRWIAAILVLVLAKLLGLGVTAFIFDVTRSKLLQMPWFEALYGSVLRLRAKAASLVDPVKQRIREMLRGDGDGWSSRMLRLIQRFRKSVHEAR